MQCGNKEEIYINTQTKTVHIHDGSTAGGFALANASSVAAKANAFVSIIENGSNVAIGNSSSGCSYVTVQGTYFTVNNIATFANSVSLISSTYIDYNGGSGALYLNGKLYANNSLGSAGQVLKINGSGYTYWDTAGSSANLQSITTDVNPSFDDVFDLGSTSKRWQDAYLTGSVNINGAALTGGSTGSAAANAVYSNTTVTHSDSFTSGGYVKSTTGTNYFSQFNANIPVNGSAIVFDEMRPLFKTALEGVPVGANITVNISTTGSDPSVSSTTYTGTVTAALGSSAVTLRAGVPAYAMGVEYDTPPPSNGFFINSVEVSYTESTLVSPAVANTLAYTLSTSADIISNGSLVATDALVGDVSVVGSTIAAIDSYGAPQLLTVDGDLNVNGAFTVGGVAVGGSYTLPTANTTTLGGVKIDGTSIISNNGVVSVGGLENVTTVSIQGGTAYMNTTSCSVFYIQTPPYNFQASFNVPDALYTNGRAATYVLVVEQGSTPYIANTMAIGYSNPSILWQGGSVPTGNANKRDVISFTLMRQSDSWIVLGSLNTYG